MWIYQKMLRSAVVLSIVFSFLVLLGPTLTSEIAQASEPPNSEPSDAEVSKKSGTGSFRKTSIVIVKGKKIEGALVEEYLALCGLP